MWSGTSHDAAQADHRRLLRLVPISSTMPVEPFLLRLASPVLCEGQELTMYVYPPRSAVSYFRGILSDLKQRPGRRLSTLYDAVVVRAADIHLHVPRQDREQPQPRADLLQYLRRTLGRFDPTRRVFFFSADSKEHPEKVMGTLAKRLDDKGYVYHDRHVSKPFGPPC